MNRTRIIQLIDNVHMGLGHTGLAKLAKDLGRDPTKLADGELIMFMNRKKDKLKILGRNGIVFGYLRMPNEHRIMPEALQYIPQTFGADGFNYEEALKKAIETRLSGRDRNKRVSPLEAYRLTTGRSKTARTQTQTNTP